MTWAEAAKTVSDRWIARGKMTLPPDDPAAADEIAFWDEVEALVGGKTKSFDPRERRDDHGRWTETGGGAADRLLHGRELMRLRPAYEDSTIRRWNTPGPFETYQSGMGELPRVNDPEGGLLDARTFIAKREGYDKLSAYDADTLARLQDLLDPKRSHLAVRTRASTLTQTLDRGALANTHQTPTLNEDRGEAYGQRRHDWERKVWSINSDNPADHPIYGYMADDQEDVAKNSAVAFGDVKLRLKDAVRSRSTFTYSDSNYIGVKDGNAMPAPVNAPTFMAVPYNYPITHVTALTLHKDVKPNADPEPPTTGPEAKRDTDPESRRLALKMLNMRTSLARARRETPVSQRDEFANAVIERMANDLQAERDAWVKRQEELGRWSRWPHGDFFEAQIFGGISIPDDVHSVEFTQSPDPELARRLTELGIPWTAPGTKAFDEHERRDDHGRWTRGPNMGDIANVDAARFDRQIAELHDLAKPRRTGSIITPGKPEEPTYEKSVSPARAIEIGAKVDEIAKDLQASEPLWQKLSELDRRLQGSAGIPGYADMSHEERLTAFYKLQDERDNVREEIKRATAESYRKVLEHVRPMGGKPRIAAGVLLNQTHPDSAEEIAGPNTDRGEALRTVAAMFEETMAEVSRYLPTDWIDQSNARGEVKFTPHTGRAYHQLSPHDHWAEIRRAVPELQSKGWTWVGYERIVRKGEVASSNEGARGWPVMRDPDGNLIKLDWAGKPHPDAVDESKLTRVPYDEPMNVWSGLFVDPRNKGTVLHEYAHRLEQILGPEQINGLRAINATTTQFLRDRTKGERVRLLRTLVPEAGYRADEKTHPDKFIDPYIGKDYPSGTTEILTMGLQMLFYPEYRRDLTPDSADNGRDLEMRHFILGLLAAG